MLSGFVYIQFDKRNKMFYLGSHIGSENDNYVGSGKRFKNAYRKRPLDFKRRIVERIYFNNFPGHFNEKEHPVRLAEQRWLNMIKEEELGSRYYNICRVACGFMPGNQFSVFGTKALIKLHSAKDERGKSIAGVKRAAILHSIKDERGKSLAAINWGRKGCIKLNSIKDERGKSIAGVKGGAKLHSVKNENGKSIVGVKLAMSLTFEMRSSAGKKGVAKTNLNKNEDGKSINALKGSTKGNHIRWHVSRNKVVEDCQLCQGSAK